MRDTKIGMFFVQMNSKILRTVETERRFRYWRNKHGFGINLTACYNVKFSCKSERLNICTNRMQLVAAQAGLCEKLRMDTLKRPGFGTFRINFG